MKTNLLLFACFMFLLVNSSCTNNSLTGPNRFSTEIFPNTVGNTWSYAHHDSLSHVSDTLVITVVDTTTLSDNRQAMIWQRRASSSIDTIYVVNSGDTVHFISNEFRFSILFPLEVGNGWKGDYASDSIRVLQKEPISVVAGTFADSYKIEERWSGFNDYGQFTRWFVPNVGFVRAYHTGISFGMANETFELISYSIH